MASYAYVSNPNPNLCCCICRMPFVEPFTTKKCSHTFCKGCITRAIEIAPICPVDRSPLSLDDLFPANTIIQILVDELTVECPHRAEGCEHTCQRQLLASHLLDGCQFTGTVCSEPGCNRKASATGLFEHSGSCPNRLVECDTCGANVRFRNLELHYVDCLEKEEICAFCTLSLPRSKLASHHEDTCPNFIVQCTHSARGCSWSGPRDSLATIHIPSCRYEDMKEFFILNDRRISGLIEENVILRHKLDLMEVALQTMKREMQTVKTVLGPWYRSQYHESQSPGLITQSTDRLSEPSSALTDILTPQTLPTASTAFEPFPPGPPVPETDILAPYFPTVANRPSHPMRSQPSHSHSQSLSLHQIQPPTAVAPLNLSTSLEGTFSGLRESLVALSTSVDSLARRNDIALRNETMRLNDEIMTLRANVHGLRMQVHGIMMDRNAQVTGRVAPGAGASGAEPRLMLSFHGPTPPSVTKL